MATLEELMAEKQRRMGQQQTGSPDLQALMAEKQRRMGQQQQPSDPFARDLKLANPDAQSLSPIPAGQSVLPDPMESKSESGTSFELSDGKWEKKPNFMKTVDMLGTGALEGIAGYAAFMNKLTPDLVKLPSGKGIVETGLAAGQKALSDRSKQQQEMYPDSWSPAVGKFAGEMAATAPVAGPAFKGLMKGAEKIGEMLPTGLKTLGKYGSAYFGGQQLGGLISGAKQDPNKPDQMFNTEAYNEVSDSVPAGLLSIIGAKAGAWSNKARELNKIETALGKPAIPRDFTGFAGDELQNLKYSPTRKMAHLVLDAPAALTGTGPRVQQLTEMLPGLWSHAMKISGQMGMKSSDDLITSVAGRLSNTMKKMKNHSNNMWEKGGFKEATIKNTDQVKEIADRAVAALSKSEIPGSEKAAIAISERMAKLGSPSDKTLRGNTLNSYYGTPASLPKRNITVDEVKSIQTLISKAVKKGYDEGGLLGDTAKKLSSIKEELYTPISESLTGEQLKKFTAAKTFYSKYLQTQENMPLLTKAITDEKSARDLVEKVLRESHTTYDDKVMGLLPKKGRDEMFSAKVVKALEGADNAGHIQLGKFIDDMAFYTKTPKIGNPQTTFQGVTQTPKSVPETLKTMEGMRMYLQSVKEAEGVGWWRQGTIAAGVGTAMGGGFLAGGPAGMAAAAVSYPAMIWAANHPYLKRAFGALTKDLSDSAYKHLTSKIQSLISRSGFLIDDDGALKHKKEKVIESAINILDKDRANGQSD